MNFKDYTPPKIDGRTVAEPSNGMYKTKCANCGNPMYTYAKDKLGTLPVVYCSIACQKNAKYPSRYSR